MPTEAQIYNTFSSLTNGALTDVYLPGLYDIAMQRRRSWIVPKLVRSGEGVKGLKVDISFLTKYGWSFRQMSEFGYTPSGAALDAAVQTAKLRGHACSLNASKEAIFATDGDQSKIGDILERLMKGMYATFPEYMRSLIWTGSTGILGVVGSIAGTTITLSNTGLMHNAVKDRAKYFCHNMFIQILDATGATKRGNPVEVLSYNTETGKITLATMPDGVVATDIITISDSVGLENNFNVHSPGIFDVIDNDNSFQGIDRSAEANAKFRAVVEGNAGTGRRPTITLLTEFFHNCYNPDYAVTDYRNIEWIVATYFQNQRYFENGNFESGHNYVKIGNTKLIEDDDAQISRIIVPDFNNMQIRDKGNITSLSGWTQIPGRPLYENILIYYFLLIAEDCRYMGRLDDIDITAAS